jgi:23S rRNA (uracil1939-C5)-methyltransferase
MSRSSSHGSIGRDSGFFGTSGMPVAAESGSVERIACEHADRCGGCPVIGLTYGDQLVVKRGRVVSSVGRYTSLELVYTEPVLSAEPVVGYRTRAKLIVAPSARLGLFAKGGGHQVVDIPQCRVLSPLLLRIAEVLRRRIAEDEEKNGPLRPWGSEGGSLRALDLREVTNDGATKALVTLVVEKKAHQEHMTELRDTAAALMKELPEIVGVAANLHDGDSPQILGAETVTLAGADKAEDRLGKSVHVATFGSFVQAHRGQAARVHQILAAALGLDDKGGGASDKAGPRILDLYGGSGAIGLSLAALGARVHLVESFGPATESARRAAEAQGLPLTVTNADSATALRGLVERGEKFDAIVVNPPRRGMSAQARELCALTGAPVVAYVSCDPDTLARDLDHLARLGYSASSLQPLDMIPLTDEVETVAILRKGALSAPRVAYTDDDIVIVEKCAHEPVASDAPLKISLTHRTRRLPGAEDAVAVSSLESGTSGLVIFVKKPELAETWRDVATHASTRRIFVAATRGVTPSKGAITRDLREGGMQKQARTRYRRLAIASGHSVLRVVPEQERTHQVRRHLAAIGHAVLGDERYGHGPTNRFFEEKNGLDRTFLHCVRMELSHPRTGQRLVVDGPLPGDLRSVLERTSGPGTLRFLDHKNALGAGNGPPSSSSLPPSSDAPDSLHDRGSVLDVDASVPSLRPEMIGDDDDFGPRGSF